MSKTLTIYKTYIKGLLIIVFLFNLHFVIGQNRNNLLVQANEKFKNLNYLTAIDLYDKIIYNSNEQINDFLPYQNQKLNKRKEYTEEEIDEANYMAGESYLKLNNYNRALIYFQRAIKSSKKYSVVSQFKYAICLQKIGKIKEAEDNFLNFINTYNKNDEIKKQAIKEIENLQFLGKLQKDKFPQFETKRLNLSNYSLTSGFNIVSFYDSNVFFNSNAFNDDYKYHNTTYTGKISGDNIIDIQPLKINEVKSKNYFINSYDPLSKIAYFTFWDVNEGKKISTINKASYDDQNVINELFEVFNGSNLSYRDACITKIKGKDALLFSAKLPGGYGGFDIYVANIDKNGKINKPINIGSKINTASDEVSPFYNEKNFELYFSSNGHIGIGGYDIFKTFFTTDSSSIPENLGIPINSIKDDLYFNIISNSKDNKQYFFSSDRDTECCLQLFTAKSIIYYQKFYGTIKDCSSQQDLTDIIFELHDSKNKTSVIKSINTNNGKFEFEAEKDSFDSILLKKGDYLFKSMRVYDSNLVNQQPFDVGSICLEKIPYEKPITLNEVYFIYKSTELTTNSYPQLDSLYNLLLTNENLSIEIAAHTDGIGSNEYNLRLSQNRAESIKNYLVSKGISPDRLVSIGYGETKPLENEVFPDGTDNENARQKNRRCEFKILNKLKN